MTEENTESSQMNDWKGFYEELQNETPRGAVIIAAAFIDEWLRRLIADFMVEDSKVVDELLGTDENADRPLSSFASRIKAAYCLGLISKTEYDDLNFVRKIRNQFAHKMHGFSFDNDQIVSWCSSLHIARMITDAIPDFPKSHGSNFLVGVSLLASQLAMRALAKENERRSTPKEIKVGQVVHVTDKDGKND